MITSGAIAVSARGGAWVYASARWAHVLQQDNNAGARFIGLAGSDFTVKGAKGGCDIAVISAGAVIRLTPNATLTADLDAEAARDYSRIGGAAALRIEF